MLHHNGYMRCKGLVSSACRKRPVTCQTVRGSRRTRGYCRNRSKRSKRQASAKLVQRKLREPRSRPSPSRRYEPLQPSYEAFDPSSMPYEPFVG